MFDYKLDKNTLTLLFQIKNQLDLLFFKEENIYYVYAPALDMTGYGTTEEEAKLSFIHSLNEFFTYTQKHQTLDKELERLGWKRLKNAHFRPPYLDELIKKNDYLLEIVRDKEFQKRNLTPTL